MLERAISMRHRFSLNGGTPPVPNKASAQGFTAAQFIQLEPPVQKQIEKNYFEGTSLNSIYPITQNLYSIGGLNMHHDRHAVGRYALNESPFTTAKQKKEIDNNVKKYVPGFSIKSPYSGTGDTGFHKDVWGLQTIVLWLTDGAAFKNDFPAMVGIVTKTGHSPTDLSPLGVKTDGRIIEDLKTVFPKGKLPAGYTAPRGPDGIYGQQTDSIVAEYIRTGKAFGKSIPANIKPLFERLAAGVSSNRISQALAEKAKGLITPSAAALKIPTEMKSGAAQTAAGEPLTKLNRETGERPISRSTPPSTTVTNVFPPPMITPPAPPAPPVPPAPIAPAAPAQKKEEAKTKGGEPVEEDNTILYWGIGLGVCALLGAAVLMSDSKKKKAAGSKIPEGSTVKLPTGNATVRRNPGCNCM